MPIRLGGSGSGEGGKWGRREMWKEGNGEGGKWGRREMGRERGNDYLLGGARWLED